MKRLEFLMLEKVLLLILYVVKDTWPVLIVQVIRQTVSSFSVICASAMENTITRILYWIIIFREIKVFY